MTRPNTAAVDTHLTRTDESIDVTTGNALQHAQQEVVQALSLRFSIDFLVAHTISGISLGFEHRIEPIGS